MAAKPPYLALIANNLQRFDIADHRLLGDAMFNLSQEELKDLISDDGYGRIFSGFTPTWTAGTNTIDFTVGVAVNSDGELMVRDTTAAHTITPVNSKVYGVYAVIEEAEDTALASRRVWNGSTETVNNSVPVKTFKKVSLGEVSDTFSGSFTVGSLFPSQVSGKTILPLAAVTVDGSGAKAFYDCRRMWAVNGNVQSSIGLEEETHNFAPTDNETLGITGVRTFFRAVADRIKAITGKSNWWTTPAVSLESAATSLSLHASALNSLNNGYQEGVRAIRLVNDYDVLRASGPFYQEDEQSLDLSLLNKCVVLVTDARVDTLAGNPVTALYSFSPAVTSDADDGDIYTSVVCASSALPQGVTGGWKLLSVSGGLVPDGSITPTKLSFPSRRFVSFKLVYDGTIPVPANDYSLRWSVQDVQSCGLTNVVIEKDKTVYPATSTVIAGLKITYDNVANARGVLLSDIPALQDTRSSADYAIVDSHYRGWAVRPDTNSTYSQWGRLGDFSRGFYTRFTSPDGADDLEVPLFTGALAPSGDHCAMVLFFEVLAAD